MMPRAFLLATAACLSFPASARAADEDAGREIVVTASPFGGEGWQVGDAATLEASGSLSLAEQLARTAPGISVNEIQGNPLQQDISYRGFTASPLLGTPQGLSAFIDGVRINQPFGDVINWDLIPTGAVRRIELVSGAAPQFGRNTLGGALVLRTKSGVTDPGYKAEVSSGSFGRNVASAEAGGKVSGGFDWFATGDHFREEGWRAFSPSRATRGFARLGWGNAQTELALSAMAAETDLNGNGLQEMRLLEADRSSIYTAPDNTLARALLINLTGSHRLSGAVSLSGNLFWRRQRSATYNGDINDEALGQNLYQPGADEQEALTLAGYSGFPLAGETAANTPFPRWRCIANALTNEEPNEKCTGLANRSLTRQTEWGGGAELAFSAPIGEIAQRLTLGLSYVNSAADFTQSTQFGYLLPDRTVMPVSGPGAFADGTQQSEDAFDARVDLGSRTASLGIYVLESARLLPGLRLDLAGRYDRTSVHNRDRISPGGGTGSLDADPVFARFNPSAAVTWEPVAGLSAMASLGQSSRAPSVVELGCSDPASPCRLPNALAGDPPLRQVIARSAELRIGVKRTHWSVAASAFRTEAADDILFVTDDPSGFGYFRNFGKTRRQGLALEGSASLGRWSVHASYTLLDATYRSPEVVGGSANSASDAPAPGFDGSIAIAPGDRIPLIARHLFKAAAAWAPLKQMTINLDMVASSGVYARGNENNRHAADGVYYLGPGSTAPYALFNLGVELRPARAVTLFAVVRNLLDRTYATAAQLGPTAFDAAGNFVARPFAGPVIGGERPLLSSTFFAPGAPRSVQAGLRLRF